MNREAEISSKSESRSWTAGRGGSQAVVLSEAAIRSAAWV